MQCPKCQFENPQGAKFCVECGNKLEVICPQCKASNAPSFKFCSECGNPLTELSKQVTRVLSFDERLSKIQKYLPKGLTEKILSQKDRIEGERKQVTVMFCDMEGFTHLSEKLGPEEIYAIMDKVYEILIHKVHDYEGTVNEMTGDGIMALFGAPIALEDAPQRAIRSSLSIHREIAKINEELKQEKDNIPPIKMRIGVHTGPVVVGTLGNDLRVEFKAVGDTVNLASRMEGLAEPGTTYLTDETFRLTEGLFRFEALGEQKIKGKEEPAVIYRVIAPSTRRTRFDVSAERGLTPLVGRERDLELLQNGFKRSKKGRGQAFSIMAEAGVGKSRLLYEFRKRVANENVTFLEGKCLSYSRGVAYHPIIDVLKSNFDVGAEDGDSEIRKKFKRGLKILGADEASTLPYLLELFSVKDSGIEKIAMSPDEKKHRISEAIKQIVIRGSEIRPLIIAIEDLHWADKSSEDYLKGLLDSISGARVFLIFTYRPEFVHTWGGRSYHYLMNLNRLSNYESLLMVAHLLGTDDLDIELEELILEKTEGVPFFIEEFIKSLKDLNIIAKEDSKYRLAKDVQAVIVPSTIQDVIMARIDSLPVGAKELIQMGSVIEREFSYQIIEQLIDLTEQELISYLSVLKDAELLYERGIFPNSTLVFRHAMTREVIYNSLLLKKKREIHARVGSAIERIYQDRLEEFYEALAYHYSISGANEKAYQYLKLSGNKAIQNHSLWEALLFFRRAIDKLKKMPEKPEKIRKQIEVIKLVEMPMRLLGYPEDSFDILHAGEELSKKLNNAQDIAIFSGIIGLYHAQKGNPSKAEIYLDNCLRHIEHIKEIKILAPIVFDICVSYFIRGEYFKILKVIPKVLALIRKTDTKLEFFGKPSNCYSMFHAWYGFCLGACGEFTEGKQFLDKSLSLALSLNHSYTIGMVEWFHSWYFSMMGDGKNCIKHAQNSIKNLKKAKAYIYLHMAWTFSGIGHYLLEDLNTCLEHIKKGLEIHSKLGITFFESFHHAYLSMAYLEIGDIEKTRNHAEYALKVSRDNIEKNNEAHSKIMLARAILKSDKSEFNQAKDQIMDALKILDEFKIKPIYAVGLYFLGETYADGGQKKTAEKKLKKAEAEFKKMDMAYWLGRTYEAMRRL
jgi:class 3 adenylate cyclase/tetratricopeptide (TPR) repeat protein